MKMIPSPLAGLTLLLLAPTAMASELVCAVVDARQCRPGGDCVAVDLAEANVPRFIEVDLKGKRLHGTRPDGTDASSLIRASFRHRDRLALHGIEGGRSWTLLLADDGHFVLAAADVDAGYSLFGECMTR